MLATESSQSTHSEPATLDDRSNQAREEGAEATAEIARLRSLLADRDHAIEKLQADLREQATQVVSVPPVQGEDIKEEERTLKGEKQEGEETKALRQQVEQLQGNVAELEQLVSQLNESHQQEMAQLTLLHKQNNTQQQQPQPSVQGEEAFPFFPSRPGIPPPFFSSSSRSQACVRIRGALCS